MEGINTGAILLAYLSAAALAVGSLLAISLRLAGRHRPALLAVSAGVLAATVLAALAALSFLIRGNGLQGFYAESARPALVVGAVALLAAGVGPFVAGLRRVGRRELVITWAASAVALFGAILLAIDPTAPPRLFFALAAAAVALTVAITVGNRRAN